MPLFEAEAKERSLANLKQGEFIPEVKIVPPRETGKSRDKADHRKPRGKLMGAVM